MVQSNLGGQKKNCFKHVRVFSNDYFDNIFLQSKTKLKLRI